MNKFCASRHRVSDSPPAALASRVGALALALLFAGQVQAYCLQYGEVSLTGTLVRQTHPGPPDYESVTKGDKPRVILILLLERNVCVVDPDPKYPREYLEREIQIIADVDKLESYKQLLGKKVEATGELMPGGARYDKPLVLKVRGIARARH